MVFPPLLCLFNCSLEQVLLGQLRVTFVASPQNLMVVLQAELEGMCLDSSLGVDFVNMCLVNIAYHVFVCNLWSWAKLYVGEEAFSLIGFLEWIAST
ncbi:hypothetical protein CK203_009108 [Vitis vinifera]|uniref:Uncharacterized protein n=1 Tax=Vitis vinifera TaxID=29760 RepID=A0A438K2U1_VITVI|nr:hypothetical protein CK203_009108 [Vitis vinifera]